MRPPESWKTARFTLVVAVLTALAWMVVAALGLDVEAAIWAGFIPGRLGLVDDGSLAPFFLTPLTATFVHAGIMHLAFNLLIFVFCGRATEGVLGSAALAILYVVGAYAAAAAQYAVGPSDLTPMVGASGAISAVIGAYSLLFGRNKVKIANQKAAIWLNALWLLVAWVVLQMVVGFAFSTGGVQVAIAAHVGGFLAGLLLARPLLLFRYRGA